MTYALYYFLIGVVGGTWLFHDDLYYSRPRAWMYLTIFACFWPAITLLVMKDRHSRRQFV